MQAPTFAGTGQDQYRWSCGSWSVRVSGTTWMGCRPRRLPGCSRCRRWCRGSAVRQHQSLRHATLAPRLTNSQVMQPRRGSDRVVYRQTGRVGAPMNLGSSPATMGGKTRIARIESSAPLVYNELCASAWRTRRHQRQRTEVSGFVDPPVWVVSGSAQSGTDHLREPAGPLPVSGPLVGRSAACWV